MKKKAFTLAEILITLGIIGIVAVLSMSALIAKYKEKETVVKLKKVYSVLDNGFNQMIFDEGTVNSWSDDHGERQARLWELFPKYFNVAKTCNKNNQCMPSSYKSLRPDTQYANNISASIKQYVLNDGTALSIAYNAGSSIACTENKAYTKTIYGGYSVFCGRLLVDINGRKGPNTAGKDVFYFFLMQDGIFPAGSSKERIWTNTFANQCLRGNAYGIAEAHCTAWVIFNGNMDYLRCDDLSWTGKTTCK